MRLQLIIMLFVCVQSWAQHDVPITNDSLSVQPFARGTQNVNKCTPWHHLKCVYITGTEVYKDGSEGKLSRHWWRMSYIGRACTEKHGTVLGKIFEGIFAVPHYIGVGLGNGIGYVVFLVRGSPDKIQARKETRKQRKLDRKVERKRLKNKTGP